MDKNVQKEEGISLMDIVRLLLSKIKLLILLVIIGGFIGGCFSVWQTKDVKYYGSNIRFYVNPENPTMSADGSGLNTSGSEYGVYGAYGEHIMDNMIKLLNEDAFAEEMLLRSQDTSKIVDPTEKEVYKYLPMKNVWTNEKETALAEKLNNAIDATIPDVKAIIAAEEEVILAQETYILAVENYNLASSELSSTWFDVFGTSYSDLKYSNLTDEDKANPKFSDVETAYESERNANKAVTKAFNELDTANITLKKSQRQMQESRATVLDLWGQTAKYKSSLSRFSKAVNFRFLLSNEDIKDAQKFARSFIYADIKVFGEVNKEFAIEVYNIIKELVPEYVEANMAIPQGYSGTNCQRISRNDGIYQTNSGYTRSQAIKSAFLMAIAVGAIASIAIIVIDKSDKRLRDCEVITREFKVPILGIVPTIEMNDTVVIKKNLANKQHRHAKHSTQNKEGK